MRADGTTARTRRRRVRWAGCALGILCALSVSACGSSAPRAPEQVVAIATSSAATAAPEGRAGPGNTGVPVGTSLAPTGDLRLSTPGQIVDGALIRGCVTIAAPEITIRNSRILCHRPGVDRAVTKAQGVDDAAGLLIEDTEIDGGGVVDIGVDIGNSTLRRLNVHGFNDGIRLGSNIVLEDSWVHDMTRMGNLHPDAVQGISAQNIVIRGNTLDPTNTDTGDLGNSAVQLGSETGTNLSSEVLIEHNLMAGGNYAVNISGTITAQNITVRNNQFDPTSRYGPIISPADVPIGAGNTDLTTGEAVDVDRPR